MKKDVDIFLIQEHWLFACEIDKLQEINEDLIGIGKSVDQDCPISLSHMPRGYGGVALLWKRSIDKYVKTIQDGSVRIQCIELVIPKPVLIASVYFPTKSSNDNENTFNDCLDQLYELIQKFSTTHEIIIGGDFNEDI